MPFLMAVGVGPVQDFIASARRSRDLWFGSWLLSELSKTAARTIVEKHRKDVERLVFPKVNSFDYLDNTKEFNVVNKIVAVIDKEPALLGDEIKQKINDRLNEIWAEAQKNFSKDFRKDKADLQIADLVEIYWTAVEVDNINDSAQYQKAREKVDFLFSARKATRNFNRVTWGGNVPKSALDGQRESVIDEAVYGVNGLGKEQLREKYGVRQGERLCGVGLLKRHGNRTGDNSFFSTSHVAALSLLKHLESDAEKNSNAVEVYARELSGLLEFVIEKDKLYKFLGKTPSRHVVFQNYDGHILFEERLAEFFAQDKLKAAKNALKKFFDDIGVNQNSLLPYYALLFADGDRMGKAIDAQKTIGEHQDLSAKLSEFADKVKEIVENNHNGSLIYAGGDDVLAFVPLHTVLKCAEELRKTFSNKLISFKDDEGKTPTLSVGIAVSHHIEPLSDALELARSAEKAAKSVNGKNALAVLVDKRSGAGRAVKGAWGTIDQRLNQFIDWHYEDQIPDGAGYDLRDLAIRLEASRDADEKEKQALNNAKAFEAKRILKRKRGSQGKQEINQSTLDKLDAFLKDINQVLFDEHKEKNKSKSDAEIKALFVDESVSVLAEELIIAKIFADAKQLANPRKVKPKSEDGENK